MRAVPISAVCGVVGADAGDLSAVPDQSGDVRPLPVGQVGSSFGSLEVCSHGSVSLALDELKVEIR